MQHNRQSIRLPQRDYSSAGAYYVTICTHEKKHYFGNIINNRMSLSQYGKIAFSIWNEIPNHFSNISLDKFIVMPNHVHGIICMTVSPGACHGKPLHSRILPTKQSLSTIIGSFKSTVTRKINEMNSGDKTKIWQRNYWERVIRNDRELNIIREYIINNPKNWDTDQMNSPLL